MQVIETKEGISAARRGQVVTIGNFDGVHAGHRELLRRAKEAARAIGTGLTVMTFEPHPAAVLHPEREFAVLSGPVMKRRLLEECGVDCLIILRDEHGVLNLSAHDFIDEFLMKHLAPKVMVEGTNFNFGAGRGGTIETLKEIGKSRGFEVITVEGKHIELDGRPVTVSSSLLRRMLGEGKVRQSSAALCRNYRLIGRTVAGRGVGTKIGFPTANLEAGKQVVPADGVYAGFVVIGDSEEEICTGGERIEAAFSLGYASTFEGVRPRLIEAHILREQVGDMRGKWMAMEFVEYIRPQKKFENKETLAEQIARDCMQIEKILTSEGKTNLTAD